jgi:hypothetical protein
MGLLGGLFGGKKKGAGDLVSRIMSMKQQGIPDPQIFDMLAAEKIRPEDIEAAINQANESMPQVMAPYGGPQSDFMPPQGGMPMPPGQVAQLEEESEDVEALVEKLVAEKAEGMDLRLKDMEADMGKVRTDIQEIKNTVIELKQKYAGLQEDSLGKVEEYAKELENVGAQIKAMQRILQQIIPSLADNISQLQTVVDKVKK